MIFRETRAAVLTAAALGVLVSGWFGLPPGALADIGRAHLARSLSVHDEGKLRLIESSGSLLIDEGAVHGTIPGSVKVRFVYNGNPSVSAQITIYGSRGTIQAKATARLSSPTSPAPSFSGSLHITGGTGSFAHAHGGGRLYGVFNRRSYALTVQTQGTVDY